MAACTVALMSPGASPSRAARARSTSMRMVGCPSGLKIARSVIPGTVCNTSRILRAVLSSSFELVAEQLDGVLALDARGGLLDVVLDVLREVEFHTGKLLFQGGGELRGQLVLVDPARPGVERLQRNEEFGVEESRGIGAVVRPAVLGDDRLDFREALDHAPHAVDVAVALLQGDRLRQRGADPEIAFLELRQELQSEAARREQRATRPARRAQPSVMTRLARANSTTGS